MERERSPHGGIDTAQELLEPFRHSNMSFRGRFPESNKYDVATSVSALQQRCNELTSVITTNMADSKTADNIQLESRTPNMAPSSSTTPPTSSPSPMMQRTTGMHVDAIVEVAPTANIGFRTLQTDNRSQKTQKGQKGRDADALSNLSKNTKCEDCVVDCLYYSQECCKCSIV